MSLSSFFAKLDDFLNPITVKELRQAVTSRLLVTGLGLLLVLQTGTLVIYLASQGLDEVGDTQTFTGGLRVFQVLQGMLLGGCMLLLPLNAGMRLANERSETNVDLFFISKLSPRSIVVGKLSASVLLLLTLFSASAPFMAFTYLLRGVDFGNMLLILGIDFLAVLGAIQFALLLGSIPASRPLRGLLGLQGFGMMIWLFVVTLGLTTALSEGELLFRFFGASAWAWAASAVLGYLAGVGFFFVWSIALLSPPTANRAMPVRIYTFIVWLVLGAAALGWAYYNTSYDTLMFWVMLTVGLVSLQVLISISERERWGPRVARTIPRSFLLRVPAFLFYSGSAGGLGFAILLFGVTFGISYWHLDVHGSTWRWDRGFEEVLNVAWLVCAYAYCYGLTAVMVRNKLLKNTSFKQAQTWVLLFFIVVLASVVPMLFAYLVNMDDRGFDLGDAPWCMVTNPPMAIDMVIMNRDSDVVYGFITAWVAISTGFGMLWALKQFQQFRRSQKPAPQEAEEIPEAIPIAESVANPTFPEGIQAVPRNE